MTTKQRINKIQRLISADPNLLERVELLIEHYQQEDSSSALTDEQKAELDARRERHLSGESKSYTWNEVKQELIDKYGLPA